METTHQFPHANGPPGFFAIQGHVYHCVRPNHPNSAVRWFLYDGFMHDKAPHLQWAETLLASWIVLPQPACDFFSTFLF
jgi:hypothetical protein